MHNFRPGVPQRLGIEHESLSAINPRLIYCAVTGYGQNGPMQQKAGYDQVLQTMTGMCSLQGQAGGSPEIIYGSVVDYYAAALLDGHIYISANTPHFWHALCDKTGLADMGADTRYDTVRKRADRVDEILPQLHRALATRSALDGEAIFGDEVPCAAARRIEEMFHHPQVQAQAILTDFEHPEVGRYRGVAESIGFGRTPGPPAFAAPVLGQDTDQILAGIEREPDAVFRPRPGVPG